MPKTGGWFFDSVALSNFAFSDGLDVLTTRYRQQGFVATQVVDELTRGVASGYVQLAGCLQLVDKGILRVMSLDKDERIIFGQLVAHLGQGEAGTIAMASHRQGIVVTDDLAVRRTCTDLGILVTGTIGILLASVRDRQLTRAAANELFRKKIEAGFHSPVAEIPGCPPPPDRDIGSACG
jgi:predicted nucleic acid-binding protein